MLHFHSFQQVTNPSHQEPPALQSRPHLPTLCRSKVSEQTHPSTDCCCLCVCMMQSSTGNSSRAGIKTGDTVIYTSSYFGDELWPSANITFTRSALARCPSPVTIVYVSLSTADWCKVLPNVLHPLFLLLSIGAALDDGGLGGLGARKPSLL